MTVLKEDAYVWLRTQFGLVGEAADAYFKLSRDERINVIAAQNRLKGHRADVAREAAQYFMTVPRYHEWVDSLGPLTHSG